MTNESIEIKEVKECLLCGSERVFLYQNLRDRLFNAPGVWSLIECQVCNLCWLHPQPLPDEIWKLYQEYYTHTIVSNKSDRRVASIKTMVKNSILGAFFGYQVHGGSQVVGWILSKVGFLRRRAGNSTLWLHAKERGRLLEIGCGNGQFLARMRELGWEVKGVEPDPEAVYIAREHFALEVFQGTIEEACFPGESFDVITMNHVIEHLPDPIRTLVECRRLLKPSGKLVVVTPNIRSLGRHLFGEHWHGWDVPRHLFLFSPKSMRTCAERAGLRVQRVWIISKIARWIWIASRLIRQDGKLPGGSPQRINSWFKLEGLMFGMMEDMLCAFGAEVGEELVLEATKG